MARLSFTHKGYRVDITQTHISLWKPYSVCEQHGWTFAGNLVSAESDELAKRLVSLCDELVGLFVEPAK